MPVPTQNVEATSINIEELDITRLVGQSVYVYSRQFPGRPLDAKVISTSEGSILVNQGESTSLLANLVNQQWVVIRFPYKGQTLSVSAQLRKGSGGRCYFTFKPEATPLMRRRFHRIDMVSRVRLATFNLRSIGPLRLENLRWLETQTVNVSSGGALISIPSVLEPGITMLLNIDAEDLQLPPLLMGEVCHCFQNEEMRFQSGIKFVVAEKAKQRLSPTQLGVIPGRALDYNKSKREKLNEEFIARPKPKEDSFRRLQ